jgi:peroxin-19
MSHINDEDLDDFDDILDDFDAPPQPKASTSTSKPKPTAQPAADDKNFEDELSRNMAALLASFGGNGAAAGPGAGSADDPPDFPLGGDDDLAKLLEQIMGSAPSDLGDDEEDAGEGLEKLLASLGQPTPSGASTSAGTTSKKASKSAEPAVNANGEPLSFEETMRQTMDRMKASEQESRKGADKVSVPRCAGATSSVCPCSNENCRDEQEIERTSSRLA